MWNELKKDIFLLSLTNTAIVLLHTWPIIYPYYASYLHSINPSITANVVFSGLLFFDVGNILANAFNPYTIRVIGYKNNLYLAAILTLIFSYIITSTY